MATMTIETMSPAEVDGQIAQHSAAAAVAQARMESTGEVIARIDKAREFERDYPWNSQAKYDAAVAERERSEAAYVAAVNAAEPLVAEFDRRGGWPRYYIVTNTGGHVHFTTACSTCFVTTQFGWLTDYSGMDRADFVQEAGSMACTVCFPDAPVEQVTRIHYEPEEKRARREERERKAAERAAAEVVVEGYTSWRGEPVTKTFKSARAVTNDIASNVSSMCWYGAEHPTATEWVANIEACRAALVAKGVDYDYDKAVAAARKKVTKEGGQPKF